MFKWKMQVSTICFVIVIKWGQIRIKDQGKSFHSMCLSFPSFNGIKGRPVAFRVSRLLTVGGVS